MCRIDADNMREILDALPIDKLFGVGQKSLPRVQAAGIRTFGDARTGRRSGAVARLRQARQRHARSSRRTRRPAGGVRSRGKIDQRGGDFRRGYRARRRSSIRSLTAPRGPHRLAPAGPKPAGRAGYGQDPPRRFHNLHPPAHTRTARRRTPPSSRPPRRRCLSGWLAVQPHAAVRLLGVGVGDLQAAAQSDLFAGPEPDPSSRLDCGGRRHPRPLRAGFADPRQSPAQTARKRKLIAPWYYPKLGGILEQAPGHVLQLLWARPKSPSPSRRTRAIST